MYFYIKNVSRKIIPLPTYRASNETCPEALFEKGVTVMAIYPQVGANS